ncbi:MAG TPA: hypothetical protein VLA12_06920, partial [Planctomycetaceae bacterium]|nr:hypothetical protein [Planctomycetaceae bacterium]
MILALLLLFSGHRPSQNPEEISLASGTGKPDPFEVTETEPEPIVLPVEEKSPFEEFEKPKLEPKPEPIVEPQPEPEPEPVIQPKPEPVVV